MGFSVAHLSDPHLLAGPGGDERAAGLRRALCRVLALEPVPDCVVLTGDLVEHGRAEQYAVLAEVLHGFPLPVHLLAGNHDEQALIVERFGGAAYYTVDYPQATVIALNSSLGAGSAEGALGAEQLDWLDAALGARPELPVFVAVHHPPIPLGLAYMDPIRLTDGPALETVLHRHDNVARLMTGHLHRPITAAFAGTTLTVAPSTYRQLELCRKPGEPLRFVDEPTEFLLHLAESDGSCVTHTVAVSHTSGPFVDY